MKRAFLLVAAALLVAVSFEQAKADDAGLFVAKCGSCHKSGGQAAVVNPADKAGRVWRKYFKRGRHPVDMAIGEGDLTAIIDYLADHAADSDQPAAAVIPK